MKAASYGVSIDSMCVHISSMTSMKHVDEVDRSLEMFYADLIIVQFLVHRQLFHIGKCPVGRAYRDGMDSNVIYLSKYGIYDS